MKNLINSILLIAITTFSFNAFSKENQSYTGYTSKDMYLGLANPNTFSEGFSWGYIFSFVTNRLGSRCDLGAIKLEQMIETVKVYMDKNPSSQNLPASLVITFAFKEKYKCN